MRRLKEFIKNSNMAFDTIRNKKGYLQYCFKFFHSIHTDEDFLKIQPSDFILLFQTIDRMLILDFGKKRYRYALKSYADWLCKEIYARNEKPELNYDFILSNRFFKFTSSINHESNFHYLELPDSVKILEWAKFTQPPLVYFAICVQLTTGMRIGGLLSITRHDIDFVKRSVATHEKTGFCNYVLNRGLIEPLKRYISYLTPDQNQIFKISEQKLNSRLQRYEKWMHSNVFRDALNSIWEDMGVEEAIRDILCCRIPKSVNAKSYLKKMKDWKKRVEKYDSIDPFTSVGF